jgi:TRAP-type mannitol/chloroaromatic compound transport system permease small subunit
LGAGTPIRQDHVRLDLLLNVASPRWRAVLDLVDFGFLMLWTGVPSCEAFRSCGDIRRFSEVDDSALRHPMWPVKLAMFAGVALIAVQSVVEWIRSVILIVNPYIDVGRDDGRGGVV